MNAEDCLRLDFALLVGLLTARVFLPRVRHNPLFNLAALALLSHVVYREASRRAPPTAASAPAPEPLPLPAPILQPPMNLMAGPVAGPVADPAHGNPHEFYRPWAGDGTRFVPKAVRSYSSYVSSPHAHE
jgi:hypothetical protein